MVDVFCPKCGYNLFGIPEVRCPECGFHYDHAAIVSLAMDETLQTYHLAKRVAVRIVFALGCATASLGPVLSLSPLLRFAIVLGLFLAAGILRRFLTVAPPIGSSETPLLDILWVVALGTLAWFLIFLPRAGSLTAVLVLVDGWRIFLRCLEWQTKAMLSLPVRKQRRVKSITWWAGAGLALSSLLTAGSWMY